MVVFDQFLGGSNTSQSPIADQERTVNFYFEPSESKGASTKYALYPTPGVEEIDEASAGGVGRAHYFEPQSQREFAVIGTEFVEIFAALPMTTRGTVAGTSEPATISGNGDGGHQLFITAGGNGYIFDLNTNVFTQVAALNGIATMGDFLDGFFLNLDAATSTMYISDLLDGLTWDPTQFVQRSSASDPWVSMKVCNKYIYLLGSQTTEPWYNAGTFPFPFAPYSSTLISYGCVAPFSPEVVGNALVWLAGTLNGSGAVIRAVGFTPEIISTFATHYAFDQYGLISDAIGDSYEDLGHTFYVLTFPAANATWVWDVFTELWCERGTWNSVQYAYFAWRPLYHAFAFGQHRILDFRDNKVYVLSTDNTMDVEGLPIRRLRRAPSVVKENKLIYYKRFELYLEPGLATSSGQGSDPQVVLNISNDGGKTWISQGMRGAGMRGEWSTRVYWNRLGAGRKRVFEIVMSDPIQWRILGAFLEVEEGNG
jgi:hypothetical protein